MADPMQMGKKPPESFRKTFLQNESILLSDVLFEKLPEKRGIARAI